MFTLPHMLPPPKTPPPKTPTPVEQESRLVRLEKYLEKLQEQLALESVPVSEASSSLVKCSQSMLLHDPLIPSSYVEKIYPDEERPPNIYKDRSANLKRMCVQSCRVL
ncbi:uncharacterized protein SPPG_06619 [Spizellomyces punctatus DAOM BR117]|uniref:G protein gamma domain-containing protein n=1 Tax=Spizellomyces punctatus (strain DAOM BR117) TaxID=645134 RepID=A0A0L0HBH9_SPIPD|nr:uncharacterized protein SPPG_06619 [Spizellomyces punctatus DAOM BR117]KNC98219.1 hypothetical protein SPPG_06619 [Spizellomyces punctatus DAOM BR117]|eukprot:XP_016606259.1 hypothetical protein SPPG_06619 [Spizellomyces punctatus DAOM BR117]